VQTLSGKVFGKTIKVEWSKRGRYGRILGMIYLESRSINRELVEEGWAWHYRQDDKTPTLAEAEKTAREKKLGLCKD